MFEIFLVAILTAIVEHTKDKELLSVIINFVLEKLLPAAHNKLPVLHASLFDKLDELLMLFYIATANNPHLDLVSVLNHKFASYVPASVMVSCEFGADRPNFFRTR